MQQIFLFCTMLIVACEAFSKQLYGSAICKSDKRRTSRLSSKQPDPHRRMIRHMNFPMFLEPSAYCPESSDCEPPFLPYLNRSLFKPNRRKNYLSPNNRRQVNRKRFRRKDWRNMMWKSMPPHSFVFNSPECFENFWFPGRRDQLRRSVFGDVSDSRDPTCRHPYQYNVRFYPVFNKPKKRTVDRKKKHWFKLKRQCVNDLRYKDKHSAKDLIETKVDNKIDNEHFLKQTDHVPEPTTHATTEVTTRVHTTLGPRKTSLETPLPNLDGFRNVYTSYMDVPQPNVTVPSVTIPRITFKYPYDPKLYESSLRDNLNLRFHEKIGEKNLKEDSKKSTKENTKDNTKDISKKSTKESSKNNLKENSKKSTKESSKDNLKENSKKTTKETTKENIKPNTTESTKEISKKSTNELPRDLGRLREMLNEVQSLLKDNGDDEIAIAEKKEPIKETSGEVVTKNVTETVVSKNSTGNLKAKIDTLVIPALTQISDQLGKITNTTIITTNTTLESNTTKKVIERCAPDGTWTSTVLGLDMNFKLMPNRMIKVKISSKNNSVINKKWTIQGLTLSRRGGPVLLAAIYPQKRKVASFIGQCKMCKNQDLIFGSWTIYTCVRRFTDLWRAVDIKLDVLRRKIGVKNKNKNKDKNKDKKKKKG